MPELPEVEVARRNLARWCVGRSIDAVEVRDARLLRTQTPEAHVRALTRRTVLAADRHGKNLVVALTGGHLWWLHLGMSGKLLWRSVGPEPAHTRIVYHFGGGRLCFRDIRLIGGTHADRAAVTREVARLDALGPDALSLRTGDALAEALGHTRTPVKSALLDQARLAGVGNIQACEGLWRAGVHPSTLVDALTTAQFDQLAEGLIGTLEDTIGAADGPDIDYVTEGANENPFRVYKRAGAPCPRDATPIVRAVLHGRATFYCPTCQPEATSAAPRSSRSG